MSLFPSYVAFVLSAFLTTEIRLDQKFPGPGDSSLGSYQCVAAMFKSRNLEQGFIALEFQYQPPVFSIDHARCVQSPGLRGLFLIRASWESAFLQSSLSPAGGSAGSRIWARETLWLESFCVCSGSAPEPSFAR